jgi:hypothetical protein
MRRNEKWLGLALTVAGLIVGDGAWADSWRLGGEGLYCERGKLIYQRTIWAACRTPLFDVTQILFDRTFAPGTAKVEVVNRLADPRNPHYTPHYCGNPRRSRFREAVEIPLLPGEWRVEVNGVFVGTAQTSPEGECEVIQPEGGS